MLDPMLHIGFHIGPDVCNIGSDVEADVLALLHIGFHIGSDVNNIGSDVKAYVLACR